MKIMDIIKQQFFCCTPVTEISFNKLNENLTWEDQVTLLNKTFFHHLNIKYPLKHQYQIAFMKKLIEHLENLGIEIHDDIYSHNCKLLERKIENSKYVYKHYLSIEELEIISLKESSNLISDGTTGLRTWEAAQILSEWCLQNRELLINKNILELGSGVGLTGLIAFKYCNVYSICLTDCHPNVLEILTENVKLNCAENKNEYPESIVQLEKNIVYKTHNNHSEICVLNLPWEELGRDSKITFQRRPDLIIASDVVYDSSIFMDLLNAFEYFCNLNTDCKIILACTVRNQDTLSSFLECLDKRAFTVREENFHPSRLLTNLTNSSKIPVVIYNISKIN